MHLIVFYSYYLFLIVYYPEVLVNFNLLSSSSENLICDANYSKIQILQKFKDNY
jgi:hypothetical protein